MKFLYLLEGIRCPFLDAVFSAITLLGSEELFIIAGIVAFWCVDKRRAYYLMSVGYLGIVANQFLKLLFRIPRPWVRDPAFHAVASAVPDARGYSFPSGHTQCITSTMGGFAVLVKKGWAKGLFVLLVLLVAFSRMYLGVHTPADVLFSLGLGTLLLAVLYPVFQRNDGILSIFWVLTAMVALSLFFVLFSYFHSWPSDMDPVQLDMGRRHACQLLGCGLGMLSGYFIENKYVRFPTQAPWWAQILKVLLGAALIFCVRGVLKPLMALLLPAEPVRDIIRYGLMIFTAVCIWPLTFSWFSRGCRRRDH